MWGYIDLAFTLIRYINVPSLYVRVYRMVGKFRKRMNCSLIICEGISPQPIFQVAHQAFPHYMWGYIVHEERRRNRNGVPSLYVRVYRGILGWSAGVSGSLIICEGISRARRNARAAEEFPHYMWGYIAATGAERRVRRLPSLYVRVYHQHGKLLKSLKCSLIICEGISGTLIFGGWWILFPHYMWGYISTISSR